MVFPQGIRDMLAEIGVAVPGNPDGRLALLGILFPPQIDAGKESDTFTWILNRVKDGTGVSTPRDVIDLVTYAVRKQLDHWEVNPPQEDSRIILESASFKAALRVLSSDKLTSHLFAEYPSLRPVVEKFRNRKAEYDEASLREIMGDDYARLKELEEVGFFAVIERSGTWWIPFVYRDGLGVTQGRYVAKL